LLKQSTAANNSSKALLRHNHDVFLKVHEMLSNPKRQHQTTKGKSLAKKGSINDERGFI